MTTRRCLIPGSIIAWCLALAGSWFAAEAAEGKSPTIAAATNWSGVLAEAKAEFTFDVQAADDPIDGVVAWNLTANRRIVARGETPIEIAADKMATTSIRFDAPMVADGVILETLLEVMLLDRAGRRLAHTSRPVRIFAADPFFGRKRWLEELKIAMYDPARNTVKQFEEAEIPYKFFRNIDALRASRPSLLIVGEGVSLQREPGLGAALLELAAGGTSVLLLAPRDGTFPLPAADDVSNVTEMNFRRHDIIALLDKRLDTRSWQGEDPIAATLSLATSGERVTCDVLANHRGWPWLELTFTSDGDRQNDGRLIVCGFAIVEHWNSGPTPRYLLAKILDRLGPASPHRNGGFQPPQNQ